MTTDISKILIAASASIREQTIRHHLASLAIATGESIFFADGNSRLASAVLDMWPEASAISAKSPLAARSAMRSVGHLVLLWDGDDLSNLLFEARFQQKKIKLIPVQVTRIVNREKTDDYDVYIGRGTPWGNPYAIGHGEGPDRAEVIAKYRVFFEDKVRTDESFRKGIMGMKGLRLACFCKPLACHGDVIAEYLDATETSQ